MKSSCIRTFASCKYVVRTLALAATLLTLSAVCLQAQMPAGESAGGAQGSQAQPSPAATATAKVGGGTIDVKYSSPRMRGRKIAGGLVPYGEVWRTGANDATTIVTSAPLKFGTLLVPAGTHTLYSLPAESGWQLIVNKQTGQWGTEYDQKQDLGRVPMKTKKLSAPQEAMSISFENTTANSTELHVRWETTDEYVTITKP